MLYQPPTGGAADDPYVGANPGLGIQGSRVPPKAVEHHQRELVSLITKSGGTPSESVLTQVTESVRSQLLNYRAVGGTANALTATLDPVPASWAALVGVPFRLLIGATNTGAATLNLNGLGAKSIVYPGDNANVVSDELVAGSVRTVIYDGTRVQLADAAALGTITTAITKTVHGGGADFADLNVAMAWLSKRRIVQGGSVTFQLAGAASGTATQYSYGSTGVAIQHPNLQRVYIQGATMLGAAPINANFTITGPSVGQRATDRGAALTVLRSRFATELNFTGGAGITILGVMGGLKDVLVTGDRTTGSGGNIGTLLTVVAGSAGFSGPVAVHGAGSIGFHVRSAIVAASSSIISVGCVGPGMQCDSGRLDFGGEFVALSNDNDGVTLNSGSFRASFSTNVGHSRGNGNNGLLANPGGVLVNGTSSGQFVLNGVNGLQAKGGGSIIAPGAICTFNSFFGISTENGVVEASNAQLNSNGQYGFYNIGGRIVTTGSAMGSNGTGAGVSVNGGFCNATGATSTAGLSPAAAVIGNNNSMNIT